MSGDVTDQIETAGHRAKLRAFLEKPWVQGFFLAVVILNAIILGVSTSEYLTSRMGSMLGQIDDLIIAIFVLEMALKLYAYGYRFFFSAWRRLGGESSRNP